MSIITDRVPTSELEAVNAMLATIGERPLTALGVSTDPNEELALNTLREVVKELSSQRWRFNTEFGYEVSAGDTFGSLSIFFVPEGLAGFRLSNTPDQRGIDVTMRRPRDYIPPPQHEGKLIFADRLRAKDGFPTSERTVLKIDPVWLVAFEDMPEPARRYALVVAARRFQARAVGSEILDQLTADDEQAALLGLVNYERTQAPTPSSEALGTEVDALNRMLTAAGMEPVHSVDALLTPEAAQALLILREAVREVCLEGWSFNTEFGVEIEPDGSYEWTNGFGETYELNYFLVPENLLSFTVTSVPWQQGSMYLDLARRPAREIPNVTATIFADRSTNRDGFFREFIYIDPVWLIPFDGLPEEARQYATVMALRRFVPQERLQVTPRDEAMARRNLKRTFGQTDNITIFDNMSVRRMLGGRSLGASGFLDWRATGR